MKSLDAENIIRAANLLELSKTASRKEIQEAYKRMIRTWHPDHCKSSPEACKAMTQKLNEAYKLLMAYCDVYPIPLDEEAIRNHSKSGDDSWWIKHFGRDPIWGA